jgi:hypothetical protein
MIVLAGLSCSDGGSAPEAGLPSSKGDGGTTCSVPQTEPLYGSPGCGANAPAPSCQIIYPCRQYACGCDGRWRIGCAGFRGPYAWTLPTMVIEWTPDAETCDPQNPPAM